MQLALSEILISSLQRLRGNLAEPARIPHYCSRADDSYKEEDDAHLQAKIGLVVHGAAQLF